jgi:quercetin dioxygenase-like cupin family protein
VSGDDGGSSADWWLVVLRLSTGQGTDATEVTPMIQTRSIQPTHGPALEPRRVTAGGGRLVRVQEHLVSYKLAAPETGNAFSLVELQTPPGGSVPLQVERFEEKTLYVLDGTYVVRLSDETAVLGAGDLAFVPRGTAHSFRNAGPRPARLLLLATPGGIHDRFLAEIGEPVADSDVAAPIGPPDSAEIRAAAHAYGITILDRADAERTGDARSPVRQNGNGLVPPSEFYRQRYPDGQSAPQWAEMRSADSGIDGEGTAADDIERRDASWEDAEWQ